jgi:hypothetical protein
MHLLTEACDLAADVSLPSQCVESERRIQGWEYPLAGRLGDPGGPLQALSCFLMLWCVRVALVAQMPWEISSLEERRLDGHPELVTNRFSRGEIKRGNWQREERGTITQPKPKAVSTLWQGSVRNHSMAVQH